MERARDENKTGTEKAWREMRILLAGMNYMPNQFTRNIEALGCEVIHTSGDPGAFPRWCDAVVIAKCQDKFWAVKNDYLKQKKQVFIADNFSSIRERFEKYVNGRRVIDAQRTSFGHAMLKVGLVKDHELIEHTVEQIKTETKKEEVMLKVKNGFNGPPKYNYDPKVKAEILKHVAEATSAGMTALETAQLLKAHGLKLADGGEINAAMVYTFRQTVRKIKPQKPEPRLAHPVKSGKITSRKGELKLVDRILDLNISAEKTVQFQRWIKDGELNIQQAIWFLDVIEEMGK